MNWRAALATCVIWLSVTSSVSRAVEVNGEPRVLDGDTLVVGKVTIRLHGIDAPETGKSAPTRMARRCALETVR